MATRSSGEETGDAQLVAVKDAGAILAYSRAASQTSINDDDNIKEPTKTMSDHG